MAARKTAQVWNGGMTGASRPPTAHTRPRECREPHCGEPAPAGSQRARMVRVSVPGSREPARWYCRGWCALYGQALADVQAIGGAM
ncbi:hypothetical protein CTZ27_37115 [Streptomyces griseocarneus]|nr:hypothetical protein CTZ27_37115 [Streptomyces griseocarneus]